MTRARDRASGQYSNSLGSFTVPLNKNRFIAGPTSATDVTVTGGLIVAEELTVTGTITITGNLNIIT
tara:strand:- start:1223 stop:1423 length:201 start_codon:yes stop_codon:yes gene_type:complete